MAIIGTLPNTISNGQAVDATPVMADFNFIVNQVNANANPIGTLTAPSGTRAIFQQAAAPTGWTTDTTITDHTLHLVATGGTVTTTGNGYGGMFNSQWTTDGHALSQAELATHSHGVNDPQHTHGSPGHTHNTPSGFAFWTATPTGGASTNLTGGSNAINLEAGTGATSVTINPASTGITTQNTGSGVAHSHTKTFNVNYAQAIVAVKA